MTEKQQQSELGCSDTIPYSIYTMKKDHLQTHSVKQVWPSSFGELWKHAVPTAGHISKSNSEHRSQIHLSNCSSSQGLDETTLLQHIALLELHLHGTTQILCYLVFWVSMSRVDRSVVCGALVVLFSSRFTVEFRPRHQ